LFIVVIRTNETLKAKKMKKAISILCLVVLSVFSKHALAQVQSEWVQYRGEFVYIPASFFDPEFPLEQISRGEYSDSSYVNYLNKHLFPLPEEDGFDKRLEMWLLNNKSLFPQYLPTGDAKSDSLRLQLAREFWMQKNEKVLGNLLVKRNPTDFSDEDFQILFNSFPRMESSGDQQLDRELYDEAVLEWIRLYSMEKYRIIEPLVRESDDLLKLNERK